MINNKVKSYIGFAKRSRKFKAGTNALKTVKKDLFLLIICKTASQNTLKEAEKLSERFNCPLIQTVNQTVEEIADKENCKLVGILQRELAKAIILNAGEDFKTISGGINE